MDAGRRRKRSDRKKLLCTELAGAVRKIQEEFVRSKQVQSDTSTTEHLCDVLEAIFLHELKNNKGVLWREAKQPDPSFPPEPSFWVFIDPLVSDEIKMQLFALRNSDSDVMKCRSWIRLMLTKGLLLSFLADLQRHPGLLAFHYGGDAILRDPEQSEVITQLLKGLTVVQLEYDYTSGRLDSWDVGVLQLAGIWSQPIRIEVPSRVRRTTPVGMSSSPAHSKPPTISIENERISPPTSDFDVEGVTIIDLALDKYSRQKATKESFTDSQLISNEVLQSTPERRIRGTGSFSSLGSGSTTSLTDPELPVGSYGAMLRSYARRNSKPQNIPASSSGTDVGSLEAGSTPVFGSTPEQGGGVAKDGRGVAREGEEISSNYALAMSLQYEIIANDGSFVSTKRIEPDAEQLEHMTKLVNEKGLDSQTYHCAGCKRPIGIIFGQEKLCKYNGQHYCFDCHRDDERIIPSRVLFNWDFRKHKVCVASCEFLDSVEHTPVLDVNSINKALYVYIPELEEAKLLRKQCKHLKNFLFTCKDKDVNEQFKKRLRSSHIYEDIHKYSLRDLIEVHNGTFNERLKKAVKIGKKHIKQCPLCSQKGFICEVCHDNQVIYPFDLEENYQCIHCSALFHRTCKPPKGSCPKCLRKEKRRTDSVSQEAH